MIIKNSDILGCKMINPTVHEDTRGCFVETYNESGYNDNVFTQIIDNIVFKQTNVSESTMGVLRGLHFQMGEHSQAKLITVLRGTILDVVVDCNQNSETYGNVGRFILDGERKEQLFVPDGCAHGFVALTDDVLFMYQCSENYNKESESGIIWNDSTLDIDWILPNELLIISDKDSKLPSWENSYKFS